MENERRLAALEDRVAELEKINDDMFAAMQDLSTVQAAKVSVLAFAFGALLRSQPANPKFSELLKKPVELLLSRNQANPDYDHYVTEQMNALFESAKGLKPEN